MKRRVSAVYLSFVLGLTFLAGFLLLPVASALGPSVNLPSAGTVNATYINPGSSSYWSITLSNVSSGYDVSNGVYLGWCNDENHYISSGQTLSGVALYSSYNQSVYPGDWNRVNYIINHKQGTWQDVQDAILYYIDGHHMPSSAAGIAMVNDADANGSSFFPVAGQSLAVVIWDSGYQTTFIEVIVPAYLTVVSAYDSPSPTSGSYTPGTNITASVTPTVAGPAGTRYVCTGWTGTGDVPISGTGSSVTFTINQDSSITWNWKTQYYLTLTSNPPGVGSQTGAGWYDAGSSALISTDPQVIILSGSSQYGFNGWTTSDMTEISNSTAPSTLVQMDAAKTVTANYVTQYMVNFSQSGLDGTATGTVVTVGGSAKTGGDLPFSMWVDNGTVVSYSYESIVSSSSSGEQFRLIGVSGSASPITVTGPVAVTGNYMIQYQVTFYETGVGSDFNGTVLVINDPDYTVSDLPTSSWYDNGSTLTFAFRSPLVVGPGEKPYFYSSTTGLSTLQSGSIIVTKSGNITGNYVNNVHDVIITNITAPAWTYQDIIVIPHDCVNISVTVLNLGDFPEDAWVTLYYNITANLVVGSYPVHLEIGQSSTLVFNWNTAEVACGTYTLTAVATIPTGSNTLSDGTITVRPVGDVNGDGRVDMKDIAMIARAYGATPTSPRWNAAADLYNDGIVNMRDLALVARHFGQHYP